MHVTIYLGNEYYNEAMAQPSVSKHHRIARIKADYYVGNDNTN